MESSTRSSNDFRSRRISTLTCVFAWAVAADYGHLTQIRSVTAVYCVRRILDEMDDHCSLSKNKAIASDDDDDELASSSTLRTTSRDYWVHQLPAYDNELLSASRFLQLLVRAITRITINSSQRGP
ncbi:hypothetical protein BDV98DRAFT_53724 [Pterulicium gracile]|uniref:Uncharacterized protein n=1 Tax=Pterulicium gracile TaxID=1884261 RepID=A0A5C3QK66_9AGAR|nr:hypothetical protein BDV98DRAFT_53724 [Pterula gracilis]